MKISAEQIRLYLLPEVEERLRHYTRLAPGEVSGLGHVEEVDGGFMVTDLFLPAQSCSSGGTELRAESVATLILTLDGAGVDAGRLRFWWHSHGSLDAFWSLTDEQCISNLANGDYVISLVTNKRGAMLARLDIFRPVRVTIDRLPVSVRQAGDRLLEQCRQELAARVEQVAPAPPFTLITGDQLTDQPDWERERYAGDELDELLAAGDLTWADYRERRREVSHG